MNEKRWDLRAEIQRIRDVADMLCTAHAILRDRFARRSFLLDLSILGLATWLAALAFVEPRIDLSLTPFGIDPQIWTGLLAVLTCALSVLQIKVDWKGKSEAHRRSLEAYSEVKREAGYLLASHEELSNDACRRVLDRYDMASAVGAPIPENKFLRTKRRHKSKVAISKYLDENPSASITLTRIRFWIRDNLRGNKP